ncbi:MAG: TolC family protein [Flavipsychrobacter sp.]|nr:TolC family protein [Flavipsychrobacter sp.]
MRIFMLIALFAAIDCAAQTRDMEYYLQQGLDNSPLLRDHTNQARAALIDSQRVRAVYKPQVTATSNNFYAPVVNGYGYDQIVTNTATVNALVNVNQNFVSKKSLDIQVGAALLVRDSLLNARDITGQELRRAIVAQYITAYGDLQQYNFSIEINALLDREDSLLRKLVQSNIYRQTDYLTFLVTHRQQKLQLKQFAIQYRTDIAGLNYLCGIYDTAAVVLDQPKIELQHLPDARASVFFQKYVIDSMLLKNGVALLNFSYRPKVSAYVNGGYYSSLTYDAYKNFGGSAGLNLTLPIYDGHQKKLQYQKIQLQEDTRQGYRDFFFKQYNQQVAQQMQQLSATESLLAEINDQVHYTETLIDVDVRQMETGDTKIADYVIAINNYLTAKNLLVQNSVSRLQIINQINYWNK